MPYKDLSIQKAAQKAHYLANKNLYTERNTARRIARKEWFRSEVMAGKVCVRCGEGDIACLDFHHLDRGTKEGSVKTMVNEHRSIESILQELSKCEILCSNCHRKLHYYEDNS